MTDREERKYGTPAQTCDRYGWGRTTLWKLERTDPDFPAPARITARIVRYDFDALDTYVGNKKAERATRPSERVV